MRNLLSKQDKKILEKEYKARVIVVALGFVLLTALVATILLLPSYIVSNYNASVANDQYKMISEKINSSEKNTTGLILIETKNKLTILAKDADGVFLSDIVENIIKTMPIGIKIRSFFYEKNTEGTGQILLLGEASGREPLLQFKKDLEKETVFLNVELPVSNLASDKDIKFSIKITGKF